MDVVYARKDFYNKFYTAVSLMLSKCYLNAIYDNVQANTCNPVASRAGYAPGKERLNPLFEGVLAALTPSTDVSGGYADARTTARG